MRRIKLIVSFIFIQAAISCSVFDEFEKSGMQLSHDRANNLYNEYNDNLKPTVQTNRDEQLQNRTEVAEDIVFSGTEYVWISKERLKMYLLFLESLDVKNGDDPITGVSIYFGRNGYGDEYIKTGDDDEDMLKPNTVMNYNTPAKKGDYRGRLTVFFAPTIRVDCIEGDEMLKHKAFYIEPKDDSPKNKYVGQYKLLDFLYDLPYEGTTEVCEEYRPSIMARRGDKSGDDGGTSVLGNDVNNMPPMTGPGNN